MESARDSEGDEDLSNLILSKAAIKLDPNGTKAPVLTPPPVTQGNGFLQMKTSCGETSKGVAGRIDLRALPSYHLSAQSHSLPVSLNDKPLNSAGTLDGAPSASNDRVILECDNLESVRMSNAFSNDIPSLPVAPESGNVTSVNGVTSIGVSADSLKASGKKKRKKSKRGKTTQNKENEDLKDANLEQEKEGAGESRNHGDSLTMRKLLRLPRYFTPEENNSIIFCFNCGEIGHSVDDCSNVTVSLKPCFLCGTAGHIAKECPEKTRCKRCKKPGHFARECTENIEYDGKSTSKKRYNRGELCLLCGSFDHALPDCGRGISVNDYEKIKCFVCHKYGHLSCGKINISIAKDSSCYCCGNKGHTGNACTLSRNSNFEYEIRTSEFNCYKCGKEGHMARECSVKTRRSWPDRDESMYMHAKNVRDDFFCDVEEDGLHWMASVDNSPSCFIRNNVHRNGHHGDHDGDYHHRHWLDHHKHDHHDNDASVRSWANDRMKLADDFSQRKKRKRKSKYKDDSKNESNENSKRKRKKGRSSLGEKKKR